MLKDKDSSAIVPVANLERSKQFYGTTLGLPLEGEMQGSVASYHTGTTRLMIYQSDYAGTNKGNAVAWGVGDEIDAIVADLRGKGVEFLRYDFPDTTYRDGIHENNGMKTAWFTDPDGNILHLNSM